MANDEMLIQSVLKTWKLYETREARVFHSFSEADLLREVAPGRNRLLYIWGHLTAISDAMLPLLNIGPKLYPELEQFFVSSPDRALPDLYSGTAIKEASERIHSALWDRFSQWTVMDWLEPHAAASSESHLIDPSRNRFTVVINRTAHIAYHLGQAVLAKPAR